MQNLEYVFREWEAVRKKHFWTIVAAALLLGVATGIYLASHMQVCWHNYEIQQSMCGTLAQYLG